VVITTRTQRVSNVYRVQCLIFVRRDGALSQMEAASEDSIEIPAGNHKRSGCGRLPRVRTVVWLDFGPMLDVAWLYRSKKSCFFGRAMGITGRVDVQRGRTAHSGWDTAGGLHSYFWSQQSEDRRTGPSSATWQSMAVQRASPARPA
jgi:hypothetical protein